MFGKRTTPLPQRPGEGPAKAEKPSAGTLATIIVPRSAVENAAEISGARRLVRAVVDCVNALTSQGFYSRLEIPAKAIQVYHADYYLAQVNNGGHGQFIANSGDNLKHCLVDVAAALAAMQAAAHQDIFARFKAWMHEVPDLKAPLRNGDTAQLRDLDRLFYDAEKSYPLSVFSARWVASWPDIKVVADAEYPDAVRQMAQMNPLREPRMIWRSLKQLEHAMTDSLRVALGMACFQIRPADGSTEFLVNVLSGNTMDVDGRQEQVWRVRTNVGERFCSLTGAHASAYECNHAKDNPPMPEFGNVEGMTAAIKDGRLAQFKGPSVGKLLSRVPRESVIEMVELAKSYRMAAGLDLLMRRAGLATAEIMTVPVKIESGPLGIVCHWLALANRKAFLMEAASKGSALLELPDKTCRATVRAPEIEEHLTKAEDGNFAVM